MSEYDIQKIDRERLYVVPPGRGSFTACIGLMLPDAGSPTDEPARAFASAVEVCQNWHRKPVLRGK